jgi:hypothetical protein
VQNFSPTPYPELNDVLQELVDSIRRILQEDFVGAYLQGSFATGGYDEHSDVDFITVTVDELTPTQVEALQAMHPRIHALPCAWAKHLEGSYIPRAVLRDYRQGGTKVWYLDHGSIVLTRSDHCNTIVVRQTLRDSGVTLAGPPPETLIDPIPVEALRQEVYAVIHEWGGQILDDPEPYRNHFYQGFIVLSYCRMLQTLHLGILDSKAGGAQWAKARLEPRWHALIDRAWSGRPDPAASSRRPPDPEEFEQTLQFMQYIMKKSTTYMQEG